MSDKLEKESENNWLGAPASTSQQPGLSTLRRGAEASEGEILLRQIDEQKDRAPKRKSLAVPNQRRRSNQFNAGINDDCNNQQQQQQQDDSISVGETTSEVNTEDDAASIVSRLSRIVVEEEERLASPSPSIMLIDEDKFQFKATELKQVKSTGDICNLANELDLISPQLRQQLKAPAQPVANNVPKINVTRVGANEEGSSKTRSKSVFVNVLDDNGDDENYRPPKLPRNESVGHLVERGNLRELGGSRNALYAPQEQRARSNTMNAIDKQLLFDQNGQLMLNIRRSAWTLSQFEETFNKDSGDYYETSTNISPSEGEFGERSSLPNSSEKLNFCCSNKSALEAKSSNNLLIKASKNALNLSQTLLPPNLSERRHSDEQINHQRRLSHCHSIVSVGSSLESLATTTINNGGKYRRNTTSPTSIGYSDGFDDHEKGRLNCCRWSNFTRYVPILEWLPKYNLRFFWGDLTAGMAVAAINISTSLSAAVVAETELSTAFRSSIISTFVFAILCSSRHTSFGSWSIMSQLLVVSVRRALSDELILNRINLGPSASWDPEDYERWHLNIIIMYTFLIGLVQLICGLLNLGNILSSFIPEALCSSMIAATAFTMAIGQLANMCGTTNKILWSIEKNTTEIWADLKNPPVDITDIFSDLFRWVKQIALLIKYNDQINCACVILSIGTVILLYLNQYVIKTQLTRLFKRNVFIPFEMILLIGTITISYIWNLSTDYRVATCGPIHIEFIVPSPPDLRLFRELWSDSVATALISYTMVYIMAKTYSNKLNYDVDANQELIACGAGNLIGGMFDALPATASFSRTAGQVEAGGKTQMASIINCILLVVLAQLLGHHVAALPVCVMSATLFFGFVRMMSQTSEALHYWRLCKVDFAIWIVTFVAILTTDMVEGFLYGFIFSILTMLYRAQNRRCYLLGTIGTSDVYVPLAKYPLAQEIDGIKIFQFCGAIHYVCADLFERLLRQRTRVNVKRIMQDLDAENTINGQFDPRKMNLPTHIILDFSMISYIDSAGIHTIKKIIEDHKQINVTIFIASLASHVAAVVKSEPSLWGVHKERFYVTLADAVHCAIRDSKKMESCDSHQNVKT